MKMGEEILIKGKVVGLMTNPAPDICTIGALAQIEISNISKTERVGNGVRFWIDSANLVLIPEKK